MSTWRMVRSRSKGLLGPEDLRVPPLDRGVGGHLDGDRQTPLHGFETAGIVASLVADPEEQALRTPGVAAVLVPGASYTLRSPQAPGPMLWNAGVTVALATDCNPGTSYFESMGLAISLAVVQMGLTVDQAIWATTRGGALSLGLEDRGILVPGYRADLLILDAPSPAHIPYRPATQLVSHVVANGELI